MKKRVMIDASYTVFIQQRNVCRRFKMLGIRRRKPKRTKGERSRREAVECLYAKKEAKPAKTIPPTADPFLAVITSRRSLGLFVINFTPHTRALKYEGRSRRRRKRMSQLPLANTADHHGVRKKRRQRTKFRGWV